MPLLRSGGSALPLIQKFYLKHIKSLAGHTGTVQCDQLVIHATHGS